MNPIEYRPHTWPTWKAEYVPKIRVVWDKTKVKPIVIMSCLIHSFLKVRIYLPYYKTGDWLSGGKLEEWRVGRTSLILRVPAVCVFGKKDLLILDGMHRMKDLAPEALIVDLIQIDKKQVDYFPDLKNLEESLNESKRHE